MGTCLPSEGRLKLCLGSALSPLNPGPDHGSASGISFKKNGKQVRIFFYPCNIGNRIFKICYLFLQTRIAPPPHGYLMIGPSLSIFRGLKCV